MNGVRCHARPLEAAFARPTASSIRCVSSELGTADLRSSRAALVGAGRLAHLRARRVRNAAPAAVAAGLEAFARRRGLAALRGRRRDTRGAQGPRPEARDRSNYDARLHRVVAELGLRPFLDAGRGVLRGRLGQAFAADLPRRARGSRRRTREALMVGTVRGRRGRRGRRGPRGGCSTTRAASRRGRARSRPAPGSGTDSNRPLRRQPREKACRSPAAPPGAYRPRSCSIVRRSRIGRPSTSVAAPRRSRG